MLAVSADSHAGRWVPLSFGEPPNMTEHDIAGNAPEDVKRTLRDPARIFLGRQGLNDNNFKLNLFGASIIKRMVVKEISIVDKSEEPRKKEGRVVLEVVNKEGECAILFSRSSY